MKREDEPYVNPLLVDAFGNKTKRRTRQQRSKSSPSTHAKKQLSKKSQGIASTPRADISDRRRTLTIIAALVIVGIVILWRPITDQITLASADPKMVQLANDAGMSRKGEVLFLRTKPQLDSDTQILNDCPALAKAINGNGGILQGCYDPVNNRIYLRQMPSNLYNLEVVTAGEMVPSQNFYR